MTYPPLDGLVRNYQRALIEVFRREPTWLCTDDTGLGKTRSGLLAPPAAWGILVLCPAGVRGVELVPGRPVGGWLAEAARVRPDLKRTRLEGDAGFLLGPEEIARLKALADAPASTDEEKKARARARARLRANEKRNAGVLRWPEPGELCVASYETARSTKRLIETPSHPVALLLDEAHLLKSPKSQQTKIAEQLVAAVRAAKGVAWGFTATPMMKDPEDLMCVLRVLRLFDRAFPGGEADFGNIFQRTLERLTFGQHRCKACKLPTAEGTTITVCCGAEVQKPKTVTRWVYGKPGPGAVERLRRVSLGRMASDVTELPPVVEIVHAAELNEAGLRALAELGRLSDEELVAAIERENVASDPDSHVARARASLAAAKRAVLPEVIDGLVSAGERVVLFADHRTPVEETVNARSGWAGMIGGRAWVHGEGDSRRELVVERFAKGELEGFAATLGSGGTGVDGLQHAAKHLVLLEESWSPNVVKQAIGRLRRIGQVHTVFVHILRTGHDVEDRVHKVVEQKLQFLGVIDEARAPQQLSLGDWTFPDAPKPPPLGAW